MNHPLLMMLWSAMPTVTLLLTSIILVKLATRATLALESLAISQARLAQMERARIQANGATRRSA